MAMRAAITKTAVAPSALRALLFSTQRTSPLYSAPAAEEKTPPAEPSDNLFVSGLSKRTVDEGLRAAFEKFGEVVDARVVKDRESGYSRGFGFVRYKTVEEATAGKEGMDGKFLDGWVIFAEYARSQPPRFSRPPQQNSYSNGFNNNNFPGRRPY